MTVRHRLPRPESDGSFAGVVLAAANVLGLGCVATYGLAHAEATAVVAPDRPAVEEAPKSLPAVAQETNRPVVPPDPRGRHDLEEAAKLAAPLSSRPVTTSPGRDETPGSPPAYVQG